MTSGDRFAASTDVLVSLLAESHLLEPADLPAAIEAACRALGARGAAVYLVDPHQRELVLLGTPAVPASSVVPIDASVPGRCYVSGEVLDLRDGDPPVVWVPLVDGTDRLGVMGVWIASAAAPLPDLLPIASLTAELVVSKNQYTDLYRLACRRAPMTLAAEMMWRLIPPLTFSSRRFAVAGIVEPAYALGGDTFDYAVNADTLHVGIFDAVGHGLDAVWPAALAVLGARHARGRGLGLPERYAACDEAVRHQGDDGCFVTAQLAELELTTGRLNWVNAGHPPPLLIRERRVVGPLGCTPSLPLGLGGEVVQVAGVGLQPGDRVVLFTDGVVEGRPAGREPFGWERFSDVVARESLAGTEPPETMRRLAHAVLDHHAHELTDDFTIVMLEYRGNA